MKRGERLVKHLSIFQISLLIFSTISFSFLINIHFISAEEFGWSKVEITGYTGLSYLVLLNFPYGKISESKHENYDNPDKVLKLITPQFPVEIQKSQITFQERKMIDLIFNISTSILKCISPGLII